MPTDVLKTETSLEELLSLNIPQPEIRDEWFILPPQESEEVARETSKVNDEQEETRKLEEMLAKERAARNAMENRAHAITSAAGWRV